jgi:hypothetical protein
MADYLPSPDASLADWMENFVGYAASRMVQFGFTASDLTPVTDTFTDWSNKYAEQRNAKAMAAATTKQKDNLRVAFEGAVRPLVKRIQASPTVTDEDRIAMGLSVSGAGGNGLAMATICRPVGYANGGQSLQHTIHFVNEGQEGSSRAKPQGMHGCEIWMKVGEMPAGPSEMSYVATPTRTPYIVRHAESDAGKTAWYRLRWISKQNEPGPWSEVIQATIAA